MKDKFIQTFAFLFVLFLSASCADLENVSDLADDLSRAVTPPESADLNPDLLTNWENCQIINLPIQGNNGENVHVSSPWTIGAISSLDYDFAHDIKPSDGWVMLFHTFCKSNVDPELMYLCLYNRMTGMLKFMYYALNTDNGTYTAWSLASKQPEIQNPLLSDFCYFSQPVNGDNNFNVESVMANNATGTDSSLFYGWNGFQIHVGEYHPATTYPVYEIKAFNTQYCNYNFLGSVSASTKGTVSTLNTSNKTIFDNTIAKAVLNASGSYAKEVTDSIANKHLNKNFIGLNFAKLVTSITAGDYVNAIADGLGLIFKTFIHSKPSYSVSEISLQTQGEITFSGTGENKWVSNVRPFSFDLNAILSNSASCGIASTDSESAMVTLGNNQSAPLELGVWNLKGKPTIYYDRYTRFYNERENVDYTDDLIDFNGKYDIPATSVGGFEIVFNPQIKPYLKSYHVSTGIIDVVGGNRTLNVGKKNYIPYKPENIILQVGNSQDPNFIETYGVEPLSDYTIGYIYNLPAGTTINENTNFYVDWGEAVTGYQAAVITVTMDFVYEGVTHSITESRVYDVVYAPNPHGKQLNEVNCPPATYLLNQGNFKEFDLYSTDDSKE